MHDAIIEYPDERSESYSLDFVCFLLLNAVLFVRPGELFEELKEVPIYNFLILMCIALSLSRLLQSVSVRELLGDSITACVLGLLVAIVVSHLAHFFLWGARSSGYEYFKIIVYYLVLLSVLHTRAQLELFLKWLVLFNCCLVALAMLQYHEIIEIPSLAAYAQKQIDPLTGEITVIPRLCGTGIFNDPNDLCLILDISFLIALYWLVQAPAVGSKLCWLGLLGLFGYAIVLTQSRGGVLALGVGLFFVLRWNLGWLRSLPIFAALAPLAALLLARRSTSLTVTEDTAQSRVQLWSEGFSLFRQNPLFGIGADQYEEQVGMVAHNSYIHCFTELGLFGGALFLGAFACALWSLRRANMNPSGSLPPCGGGNTDSLPPCGGGLGWGVEDLHAPSPHPDPPPQGGREEISYPPPQGKREKRDPLAICLMSLVGCYAWGILTLSRPYVPPTYMLLGLTAAYFRLPGQEMYRPLLRVDARKLAALAPLSCAFLACAYLYVRTVVRWD